MKPKTYTQLYIQLVFAVKNRHALLSDKIRPDIFKYMGGIISEMHHKPLIINGPPNHVHILFGLNPSKSISETVLNIKRSTSLYINREKLCTSKFSWQEGYGAFSYSKSQIDRVYHYIQNQEQHHKKKTFKEEYVGFLKNLEIEYNEKFLFDFIDGADNNY
jgi:REP element-mobilizing transposase RayT